MADTSGTYLDELTLDGEPDASKWLKALQVKYPEIYYHCSRVAMLAEKIAVPLNLSDAESEQLIRGCFLHDIGKAASYQDLNGDQEMERLHPIIGAQLAAGNPGFGFEIVNIIKHHHERWDGKGYPDGLAGEEIPLGARICAVVNAFDTMTSHCVHHLRLGLSEAKLELIRKAGSSFDPDIVHAMMQISEQTLDIYSL